MPRRRRRAPAPRAATGPRPGVRATAAGAATVLEPPWPLRAPNPAGTPSATPGTPAAASRSRNPL
eukprot:2907259-Lingulodinium_polyedra.AAC.1